MKITRKQLKRIIRESILNEILPGGDVPRSVQADYDLANKEDTFPKRKLKKPKAPSLEEKQVYEDIKASITRVLQSMPGYSVHMAGEAATVELPVEEVAKALQPVLKKLGANVADGMSSAGSISISHPASPNIRMSIFQLSGTFAPAVTTTEIDFGIPPGEGEPY